MSAKANVLAALGEGIPVFVFNTPCISDCPGKKDGWRGWEPLNLLIRFQSLGLGGPKLPGQLCHPSGGSWTPGSDRRSHPTRRVPCQAEGVMRSVSYPLWLSVGLILSLAGGRSAGSPVSQQLSRDACTALLFAQYFSLLNPASRLPVTLLHLALLLEQEPCCFSLS